jgi:imidazolonepropionase-like amidohydrolase
MSQKFVLAGWLVDGNGMPAQKNVLLRIENSRFDQIQAVTPEFASQEKVLDFSRCTLLPGLIDAHVHLFMSGTENPEIREKQLTLGFDSVKLGIDQRLGDLINHGVVACRDGGDRQAFSLKYKREYLARNGLPVEIKLAGHAWYRKGRYGKMIGRAVDKLENLAGCIAAESSFVDHIKIVNSGLNSLLHFGKQTPPQFDIDALREAVAVGKKIGCKTMVHANGKKPVENALKAGCHSIEHGFFMGEDNLKQMADDQVFWVPTAVTMKAYQDVTHGQIKNLALTSSKAGSRVSRLKAIVQGAQKNLEHQLEQISKAKETGVPIAVGTDSGSPGVYHGASMRQEMQLLTTAGFSIEETVQCACANGAELLDLRHCGRLEKGMDATFVVVVGPPAHLMENLASPEAVVIKGRSLKAASTR